MIGAPYSDSVADDELLARYILRKEHVRHDGTLKPDPFIPFQNTKLSVTRHIGLREVDIWEFGEDVARQRQMTLYGRGDTLAQIYRKENLKVHPASEEGNPNHANVSNWPSDKPSQKAIALEIVKSVQYTPKPCC